MAKPQPILGLNPKQSFHQNARIVLPQRMEEVYRWEQYIKDPKYRDELHNMRISVKRLRYTMEFFFVNYDNEFSNFLEVVIGLQDILGDIHDSDVVLDILTDYKTSCRSDELLGVDTLITRAQKKRHTDYEKFLRKWEHLSAIDFKQRLFEVIVT